MYYSFGKESLFGIPLVTRLSNISCGYDVQREFMKIINPFLMRAKDVSDDYENNEGISKRPSEDDELGDTTNSCAIGNDADSIVGTDDGIHLSTDFEFYLHGMENAKLILDKPLTVTTLTRKGPEIVVVWSDKMLKMYNTSLLDSLPEVFKSQLFTKRIQESVSIYKCLEAFLKEEPLGPEDMWLVDI